MREFGRLRKSPDYVTPLQGLRVRHVSSQFTRNNENPCGTLFGSLDWFTELGLSPNKPKIFSPRSFLTLNRAKRPMHLPGIGAPHQTQFFH